MEHCAALRILVSPEHLDATLAYAERHHLSALAVVERFLEAPAQQRRERAIERRIRDAHFPERKTLESFDWSFNAPSIDRIQIEALATAEFIRRKDNLIFVGQSGVGKSHLIQALGIRACALGYRVRYTTSAALLEDLTASLADKSLPQRLRLYERPQLLVVDEFGLDKIERAECSQAASLLYKVVDRRNNHGSTALVTNIDFDRWPEYLGDAPLAMALLDRIVDRAIILKIKGRSYRAHRAQSRQQPAAKPS